MTGWAGAQAVVTRGSAECSTWQQGHGQGLGWGTGVVVVAPRIWLEGGLGYRVLLLHATYGQEGIGLGYRVWCCRGLFIERLGSGSEAVARGWVGLALDIHSLPAPD